MLGAALTASGAGWMVAARGTSLGRRWQIGWGLIALALLSRAVGDALWIYFGLLRHTAIPASLQPLAGYSLALQPLLLCVGLWFLAARSHAHMAGKQWTLALDAIVLSGSVAALLWWFWLEPMLLQGRADNAARLAWPRPFSAAVNTLGLVLIALTARSASRAAAPDKAAATGTPEAAPQSGPQAADDVVETRRDVVGTAALFAGVAFLAVGDYRFFMLPPRRPAGAFEVALLVVAPLLIGFAALWRWQQARAVQRQQAQNRLARPAVAAAGRPTRAALEAVENVLSVDAPSGLSAGGLNVGRLNGAGAAGLANGSGSNGAAAGAALVEAAQEAGGDGSGSLATDDGLAADGAPALDAGGTTPGAKANEKTDSRATGGEWSALAASSAESLVVLALPCFVALMGAWHLSGTAFWGASHPRAAGGILGEMWWGPVLVLTAAIRHATVALQSARGARQLSEQTVSLKQQVALRTHQLGTLHTVSADLNNTLNRRQVLATALERMIDAVRADAGAVWLRSDFDMLSEEAEGGGQGAQGGTWRDGNGAANGSAANGGAGGNGAQGAGGIKNAAFLRRESERRDTERREMERRAQLRSPGRGAADAGVLGQGLTPASFGPRWRLVRASGYERDAQRHALNVMNEALERGGLTHCALVCSTQAETFGAAHVAQIRWKGEVMGALGVMRWQGEMEPAEHRLLESIALEVGAALQNAHLYQEAMRRANLDGVTDLYNHRTVQEKLAAELTSAREKDKTLTIVMMDLNNFKFFNDTYGHPVGDTVLRTVAQCLRDTCRTDDVIGRYGGDEFVAILPDTDAHGALEVCSRIAARVEEEAFQEPGGRRVPIGLSFGAAVFPHDGDGALELLTVADANLYEAKRGGAPLMIQRAAAEETQELRQLKDVGVGGSFGVLDALVTAIDNKDHYTRRHSEDVTHWATLMARELGYSTETQRAVRICGLLHDVGKIAVPDAVLRKPGRLNDDEFNIMQQHPVFGALIVKDVPNLNEVLGGIRHHHERFDGKGYPDKMVGEDIPMMGRLLAVPDCFSAMTTDRPYRKAFTWSEALTEIERGRGTQFDPVMADAFLEVIARIIADGTTKSFDKDGTRHSVLQLPATGEAPPPSSTDSADGTLGDAAPAPDSPDSILRPRSVTDADTSEQSTSAQPAPAHA